MTAVQDNGSGSGLFSKLVIVLLLAATVGFYLKIVMLDEQQTAKAPMPQASIQVVEHQVLQTPATATALKELPDDQVLLIKQVFAPELQ